MTEYVRVNKNYLSCLLPLTACVIWTCAAWAQDSMIEFGANSSHLAFDGKCSDPRFVYKSPEDGGNIATEVLAMFQDAADCKEAFKSESVELRRPEDILGARFEIGDDDSDLAGNEVCNDPRFVADPRHPKAVVPKPEAREHDKSDCFDDHLARLVWPRDQDSGPTKGIAFGDDSGQWDEDSECDDPRFWGVDVADTYEDGNVLKDATDCRNAVRKGTAHLVSTEFLRKKNLLTDDQELGDDSGEWAFDGECDDPRFKGVGVAATVAAGNALESDATDCGRALLDGMAEIRTIEIFEVGDDAGAWAGNDVCNDPRFVTDPRRPVTDEAIAIAKAKAKGHDAGDCINDYLARLVWPTDQDPGPTQGIAFGDDSGKWAFDGECDDPRFWGGGVADTAEAGNVLKDANDCRDAVRKGSAHLVSTKFLEERLRDVLPKDQKLGDDSSEWAFDGECDDPRFDGVGVADTVLVGDILKDATDCGRALLDGRARVRTITILEIGDDAGEWAGNGVCNDPRFVTDPRRPLTDEAIANANGHDAGDCFNDYLARLVWPTDQNPGPTRDIAFGDDSGDGAFDGDCDDPRFAGEGVAETAEAGNVLNDATDCRDAVRKGSARLESSEFLQDRLGEGLPEGMDLGDDSGEWAFDGECDDPRFKGEGVADTVAAGNALKDATDCGRALLFGSAEIIRPLDQ